MKTNIRVNEIDFELTDQLMETLSVHEKSYLANGFDDNGNKYTGIALVVCGEIETVTDIEKE